MRVIATWFLLILNSVLACAMAGFAGRATAMGDYGWMFLDLVLMVINTMCAISMWNLLPTSRRLDASLRKESKTGL